jgi:amidohydrolase
LPKLIALRHDLHACPELAYEERHTAGRVLSELSSLPGFDIQKDIAVTGIVATLCREKSGPCVALRADMDALPIEELTGKPYASKNPRKMHACGHDGHTTCLVGAAHLLSEMQDKLAGPVKFIFQPAEEGGAGGEKMCGAGVLKNPDVKAIFALHGYPDKKVGEIGFRPGPILAGGTRFFITVKGRGGHAASPHRTVDPIVIGSHIVVALQSIVSRASDPLQSLVVTVGEFHAGSAPNIIPETVEMTGTIRAFDPQLLQRAAEMVQEISENIAEAHGAEVVVDLRPGYPPLLNDARCARFLQSVGAAILGEPKVDSAIPPSMGSEDFAYYLGEVPGAFWRLGICPQDKEHMPGLHEPTFDFNDDAIATGVRMHCEIALRFANSW